MAILNEDYLVEGVEADGSRTSLFSSSSSVDACRWMRDYVKSEDAGGWGRIEVYDTRGEDAERIAFWERDED